MEEMHPASMYKEEIEMKTYMEFSSCSSEKDDKQVTRYSK
jgi:hypothetical protein